MHHSSNWINVLKQLLNHGLWKPSYYWWSVVWYIIADMWLSKYEKLFKCVGIHKRNWAIPSPCKLITFQNLAGLFFSFFWSAEACAFGPITSIKISENLQWFLFYKSHRMSQGKTNKMTCASSEDSAQPGHPPSLIRVWPVRMKPWVL